MASIVRTDSISTVAGTGNITLQTGNKIVSPDFGGLYAPGQIIRVVQTTKTNATSSTVAANTWTEFDSSFRVAMTPVSANSKVLISAYISAAQNTGTIRYKFQYSIDNGSTFNDVTPIADASSSHSRGHFGFGTNSDNNQVVTCGMELLHSPSTTNNIIYRVLFGVDVATTYYFNRSINYYDNFLGGTYTSTFILKEVAG